MAEEARRKAEVERKRQRELEVKEAERDAAEMAELKHSDPEVRVVFAVGKVPVEIFSITTKSH